MTEFIDVLVEDLKSELPDFEPWRSGSTSDNTWNFSKKGSCGIEFHVMVIFLDDRLIINSIQVIEIEYSDPKFSSKYVADKITGLPMFNQPLTPS